MLSSIDPFQFGGIPRSSSTKALISMVHAWTQATDGTGNAVRVVLFDYKKAFDLIDHKILATKTIQLPMPTFIKRWVIDFLMNRQQRVKLARDCMSEWIDIPSGVSQGTKLGPWLFILMINDLRPPPPHIMSDRNTSMMLRYLKLFTSTHPVKFKIQSIVFNIGL